MSLYYLKEELLPWRSISASQEGNEARIGDFPWGAIIVLGEILQNPGPCFALFDSESILEVKLCNSGQLNKGKL